MPSLNKVLGKKDSVKKQMTDEEMFEKVKALNKAFGGVDIGSSKKLNGSRGS